MVLWWAQRKFEPFDGAQLQMWLAAYVLALDNGWTIECWPVLLLVDRRIGPDYTLAGYGRNLEPMGIRRDPCECETGVDFWEWLCPWLLGR